MFWKFSADERPKFWRVIKFFEVTQFVEHDVFRKSSWEQHDFVIKIEITKFAATSPIAAEIFYKDFFIRERIARSKKAKTEMHECARGFFVAQIIAARFRKNDHLLPCNFFVHARMISFRHCLT